MNSKRELSKFREYLEGRVQPGTVRMYMHSLSKWFSYLDGGKPTQETAQQYVDLLARLKSPSTVSLRAHAIMRWFRWKGNLVQLDSPTVRMGEPKYLPMSKVELVMSACNTVLEEALIVVLFDTAVRISELLNLETDDINWNNGFISVVRKGGRREEVNISDKGLRLLKNWLDARSTDSRKVFMGLSYQDAREIIRKVGKRVGIHLHPHMLRHSRAIQMLTARATLHDVQMHLGHTSITTTANIYGRFRALDLRERIPAW